MEQGIHSRGGGWKEAIFLQATQGERGCVACHHLPYLYHVYIMVHATVTHQHSQYLSLMHTQSIILDWSKNAQGPRQRVWGEALTQQAQSSSHLQLDTQCGYRNKKGGVFPYLLFSSPPSFPLGKILSHRNVIFS